MRSAGAARPSPWANPQIKTIVPAGKVLFDRALLRKAERAGSATNRLRVALRAKTTRSGWGTLGCTGLTKISKGRMGDPSNEENRLHKDVRSCGGHLERLFGSGLIFVPGIPECPFVLKSTSVYHAKLQLRNLAVLGQRVDPPVSMFGNHASE